ncbi:YcnI family protein [Kaistia adipata]|uniref:YcnI family copper-binding membrane protein n=1 Tax=Kaistia adipata TaxID=166954 RepID=UPI0004226ACF|nr:DUF1775 domain-containing protein [Kaistia adipata]
MNKLSFAGAAGVLLLSVSAAAAHVTLATPEATLGGSYKAVLQVGHGCAGSPTVKVRVQIPEGVVNVKPQPKPGWTVETVKGAYAKSYDLWGAKVSEGVKEIVWSGGSLPDDFYDEFAFRTYLTADLPAGPLYFPVVQECEKGSERWIEIPAPGKSDDDYESPAPAVILKPKG